jgi:HSP20 family protein
VKDYIMTTTMTRTETKPEAGTPARSEPRGLRSWFSRDPFLSLREELDSMLARMSAEFDGGSLTGGILPSLDMSEADAALEIRMDVPGFKPDEIDIQVTENTISVSGQRQEEKKDDRKSYHRVERRRGSFARTVALPCGVNADKAEASIKDGVLMISIPKSESARIRKVKVKT